MVACKAHCGVHMPLLGTRQGVLTGRASLAATLLVVPWECCLEGGAAAAARGLQAHGTETGCNTCHAVPQHRPHAQVWWHAGACCNPLGCLSQQRGHRTMGGIA